MIYRKLSLLTLLVFALSASAQVHLFRQDSSRTGKFSAPLPLPLALSWQKTFAGASFSASAVKCQDKLFVGSRDKKLYILNAFTGEKEGEVATQGWVDTPPACDESKVYFGDRSGRIYAFDYKSQTLAFVVETGKDLLSSPLIDGNLLYMTTGALDPALYILDKTSGSIVKTLSLPQPSFSSPVKTNHGVLVAANTGKYFLVQDGAIVASFDAKGETNFFTPFSENSTTYALASDYSATLYKLSLPDLTELSRNPFLDSSHVIKPSALADGGDKLFLSAGDIPQSSPTKRQKLFAFDKQSLALLWQKELSLFNEWPKVPSPLYGDDKLLITTFDGKLLVLSSTDGSTLQQETPDSEKGIMASPFYQNGQVFVATLGGTIAAYEVASSDPAPSVTISSPKDKAKVNKTVSIKGSITEDHLKFWELVVQSKSKVVASQKGYAQKNDAELLSFDTTKVTDGDYTATLRAYDIKGNQASSSVTFTVDNTPPALSVSSPSDGSFTNQKTITVKGTTDGVLVKVNAAQATLTKGNFEASVSLSEGENTLTVEAQDEVGNSTKVNLTVTLDTKAPSLTVTTPTDGEVTNKKEIIISGSVEVGANLTLNGNAVSYANDGSFSFTYALTEGANTLTFIAEDRAKNKTEIVRKVTYDPNAPPLSITEPEEGLITNKKEIALAGSTEPEATLTLNGTPLALSADGSFSTTVSLVEGENKLTVEAKDTVGNSSQVTRTVYLDTVAPALTLDSPEENFLTNQKELTVSGKAEASSTVRINGSQVTTAADGSFSFVLTLQEGENTILVEAQDEAGNLASITRKGTLDTIPPDLFISSPQDGLLTNQPQQLLSGSTEPGAKLFVNEKEATVQADGSFSFSLTLSEGTNTIEVMAKDQAGNETKTTITLTLDTIPPTGSLAISKNAFGVSSSPEVEVTLTAKDQGSGVKEYVLSEKKDFLGVQAVALTKSPLVVKYTFSHEGSVTLYYKVVDKAGNESEIYSDGLIINTESFLMVPLSIEEGGVFKTKDGTTLEIPEASLKLTEKFSGTPYLVIYDPQILGEELPPPDPRDFRETSVAREILVTDGEGKKIGVQVAKDLSLTLSFQGEKGEVMFEENLRITYYNSPAYEVLEKEQKVDKKNKTVTAQISHFSLFRLLEVRVDQEDFIAQLYHYPNPFSGKEGVTVTYKLKGDAQEVILEYFTVSGKKIAEQFIPAFAEGSLIGRNRFKFKPVGMERFANGVYFLRVVARDAEGKRHSAIFKSVILR